MNVLSRVRRSALRLLLGMAGIVASMCVLGLVASPALATCDPSISTVTAMSTAQTQSVAIAGSCFGTNSSYTNDDSSDLEITDETAGWNACYGNNGVTCSVSSWSDSEVDFTGFSGDWGEFVLSTGDVVEVSIWNPQSGNGPSECEVVVGGGATTCGAPACTPHISSISAVGTGQTQSVAIDGTCLGILGSYSGADSRGLQIDDETAGWNACYDGNGITCSVSSWSDSEVDLSGFSGDWGGSYVLNTGDVVVVSVWNPQTGDGPTQCKLVVGSGATDCDDGAPPGGTLGQNDALRWDDTCASGPGSVDCASGDMNDSFTDISVPGPGGGLSVSRTYNSLDAGASALFSSGLFGPGWSCSFCSNLSTDSSGDVTITEADGSQALATPNGSGGYDIPGIYDSSLIQNEDGSWTFVRQHGDSYDFNADGQLTGITDLNGYTTSFAYTDGELSSITNADGQSLAVTTNSDGQIASIEDPNDQTVSYGYNDSDELTTVTNSDGDEWQYGYDGNAYMTSMTDPNGNAITTSFDSGGRVLTQTQANDAETQYSYSGDPFSNAGGTTVITDPDGHQEQQQYTNGELVSLTKGYGTSGAETWTYGYDPSTGGMTSETGPRGYSTTYTYDSDGNRLTESDPLGNEWQWTYNALSEVLTSEDPLGVTTTNTYNSDGDLLTSSTPLLNSSGDTTATQETQYTYGDLSLPGYPTVIEDPDGHSTDYAYGSHGNLTSTTDPLGDETTYSYDADGRILTEVSPNGNVSGCGCASDYTTTYTYNALNEPLTVMDPDGNETTYTYDSDGDELKETQPSGTKTVTTFNDVDEPTQVQIENSGGTVEQTTSTGYDDDGNVTSQTDGADNETTYAYNALGQESSTTNPLSETTSYTYDPDGNLETELTPNDVMITDSYNHGDELTGTSYSGSEAPSVSYSYDADGRQTGMTDGIGTSAWTFNSLGDLTSYTNGASTEVQYGYNLDGDQTSITYPGDNTVTQGFNNADEETSVTGWNSYESTFGYDPDGNLTTEDLANGVTDAYTYDAADNLTGIDDTNGASTVFSATYGLNADELVNSDSSQPSSTGEYKYTALNQLCYAGSTNTDDCGSAPSGADTYGYGDAGNLTDNNGTAQSYNTGDELCWTYDGSSGDDCGTVPTGATTYTYDADGNRTATTPATGSATAYTYNGADQLTGYELGTGLSTSYAYDGQGLRESKTTSATTTTFLWDESASIPTLLEETTGSNTTSYIYGPQGLPLEEILPSGATYYYAHDDLGSTRALTDSSGDVADTDTYDPYGNLTTSTGTIANNLLYAGQYYDHESGLYYMRTRYYDPTTSQFISVDPLVASTQEPYGYTTGDPTNANDITGDDAGADAAGGCAIGEAFDPLGGCVPGVALGELADGITDLAAWFASSSNDEAANPVSSTGSAGASQPFDENGLECSSEELSDVNAPDNAEIARGIAGHSAEEHFPGSTEDQVADRVQGVLDSPQRLSRDLGNGRAAYYDDGTVVVRNPNVPYGGTAYPGDFQSFLNVK
jgi:RHS repeat-associated protein